MQSLNKYLEKLFYGRDITALVIFRISFGIILLWEALSSFQQSKIQILFLDPKFNFTYEFFGWLKPWEGSGMYIHFGLLGLFSFFVMIGFLYRISSFFVFILFTYIFLIDETIYLNHYYLVSIISFFMIFLPAHKSFSLDSVFWKKIQSNTVPGWSIIILQIQMGIVYFYGGLAKINTDWLLSAEPMKHWLQERTSFPWIGQYFTESWMAYFMSWSGTLIDILAPFLLLNRKTRPFIFLTLVCFHFMNDRLFQIGIFPWFGIMASTVFFPSDYLSRIIDTAKVQKNGFIMFLSAVLFTSLGLFFHNKFDFVPFIVSSFAGIMIAWLFIDLFSHKSTILKQTQVLEYSQFHKKLVVGLLTMWTLIQVAVPLRHFFIPGNVSWTEEGHRFSWHMKLRNKDGDAFFYLYNPATKKYQELDINYYLSEIQYTRMAVRPYMILDFAKFLREDLEKQGLTSFEIRVVAFSSYNYRPRQKLIRSDIDLSKQTFSDFRHNDWIYQIDPKLKIDSKESETDNNSLKVDIFE